MERREMTEKVMRLNVNGQGQRFDGQYGVVNKAKKANDEWRVPLQHDTSD